MIAFNTSFGPGAGSATAIEVEPRGHPELHLGNHMSRAKSVETDKAREKRLAENTADKIASRQNASDALDERVRENIKQHGA